MSAENSRKPLSDSQISEILGQQGIVVARRTVAKYRESLQILPVNLSKDALDIRRRLSMNLHLTGHHFEITPAIRDYVSRKLERITHHFDHVIDVNVIMSVEKLEQKIEANVHVRGSDIHCESTDADMYAAIDGLIDKLDRTIIKHKEKSPRAPPRRRAAQAPALPSSAVGDAARPRALIPRMT